MKKLLTITLTMLLIFAMALPTFALDSQEGTKLSGQHDTLNIIGVQNPKTADMNNSNGSTIFVPLTGITKIYLEKAPEGIFKVTDANGTDGSASFMLPDPGYDPYVIGGDMTDVDTESDYSVFVRPLGKPDGWSTITTCAQLDKTELKAFLSRDLIEILNDQRAEGYYASVEQVGKDITFREKGKTSFTNVTAELTSIVLKVSVDTDGNGIVDTIEYIRVPIFDKILEGQYWEYAQGDKGLKLLQVRFYPFGTDVTYADEPFLP